MESWMTTRIALALLLVVCACSGKIAATAPAVDAAAAKADAGGSADAVPVNNWVQGFSVKMTFHGGANDGAVVHMERDLQGRESTTFAFGSVHKTPPAISLSVQDSEYVDGKPGAVQTKAEFQFNFGNLIGSSKDASAPDPVHLPKPGGDFPFGCRPPNLFAKYKNFGYRSVCGTAGHIVVTDWSATKGGRFAGYFAGTLHSVLPEAEQTCAGDAPYPPAASLVQACAKQDWTVDVEGTFGFTLPGPDGKP